MKRQFIHKFEDIISIENLLEAWKEFIHDKRKKQDVQEFSSRLMDNILSLHSDLANRAYTHGGYQAFNICDPKPRNIHKATVRDRLLHHAIYRILYSFFDKVFIADSFSCRLEKGTHKAINRFRSFAYKVSKNNTKTCWILKCDIRKFFANIDHDILKQILRGYIPDKDILWLLDRVIDSFEARPGVGLPLGNLTSQLLVNIYMNEFDQFVKHKLSPYGGSLPAGRQASSVGKVKYYIRYADDFVIFSEDRNELESLLLRVRAFLFERLALELHLNKVSIETLGSGVDFLGWVNFPDHRVLRTATKRRMLKRIQEHPTEGTLNSYFGLLGHGNAHKLKRMIS